MGKSQIIHTDGEDLVVIARSDYEALLARAGEEASEDAMTARIIEATDAKIARGEDVELPAAVWGAIESGERNWDFTRVIPPSAELADASPNPAVAETVSNP